MIRVKKHEMARFGGNRSVSWESLFKDQLNYVSEGVENLIDALQLVSDDEPHDCLQDAADGVEYLVDFVMDYGAEEFNRKNFGGFDSVRVHLDERTNGKTVCYIKLNTILGNLQERINESIENGSGSRSTRDLVWYAFTSCRSRRNSERDITADFEIDLTIIYR